MSPVPDPDPERESSYTLPSPPELDKVTYLYGHPLLNSLSPLLHKTIYTHLNLNWAQIPLSTSSQQEQEQQQQNEQQKQHQPYTLSPPIPSFLSSARSSPKFTGSSVTMPHKVSILPYLDDLTDEAKGAGACNTIFLRQTEKSPTSNNPSSQRQLVGTNTDCIGIREALLRNSPSHAHAYPPAEEQRRRRAPALIIGGGGTARAAIYTLTTYLHHTTIYIINRDASEVHSMIAEHNSRTTTTSSLHHITHPSQIPTLQPPSTIISAIPNYPPTTSSEIQARQVLDAFLALPQDPTNLHEPRLLLEMCYHPHPWTSIAEAGDRAGWTVILGTEAMVWQGLEQARLWTGRDEITTDEKLIAKVKKLIAESLKERN